MNLTLSHRDVYILEHALRQLIIDRRAGLENEFTIEDWKQTQSLLDCLNQITVMVEPE